MLVVTPLLQGVTTRDTQTEICSSPPSTTLFERVCFLILNVFQNLIRDTLNLSTDSQSSGADIYRTNSKHKAKHEAMWGKTP